MDCDTKIKPLTKEQMFLYFDRLTRFKFPEDKYFRVFSDIILKNLIFPSISKKELLSLCVQDAVFYAKLVWDKSLEHNFKPIKNDFVLNKQLYELENGYFNLNCASKEFINTNLNFLPLMKDLEEQYETLPINLKRVCDLFLGRNNYSPIKKIVLVEGITEDILLPQFSKLIGCDFDKDGFYIVVSGGKNQIVKQYTNWHKILKLPVFILLDADGGDVFPLIKNQLEPKDEIYMLKSGEFEDIIDKKLVLKTLKSTYPNIIEHISKYDFDETKSTVENLENYFKINGLGEFKKADFAQNLKNSITKSTALTNELEEVIEKITTPRHL